MRPEWPRLAISAVIVAYFGYAMMVHWTNGIEETIKNAFLLAVGYWIGAAKGLHDSEAVASGKPDDPVNMKEVEQ